MKVHVWSMIDTCVIFAKTEFVLICIFKFLHQFEHMFELGHLVLERVS